MLLSEFYALLDDVFGVAYARTLAREFCLTELGDRTPARALEDGVAPRDVWHALCDAMEIDDARRAGGDRTRLVPPPR